MTTRKLLWGMTWRGAVWGVVTAIIGSISNLIMGSIVANVWNNYTAQFPPLMPDSSIAFATIFLVAITPIIALSIYYFGILTGLLCGLITIKYFDRLVDTRAYKRIILFAGLFFNLFVGLAVLMAIFWNVLGKDVVITIIFVVIPSCVNAICGLFVASRLALWYEHESANGIAQNVSSN